MTSLPRFSPFLPLAVAAAGIAGWMIRGATDSPRTRATPPPADRTADLRRESRREREQLLQDSIVRRLKRLARAGRWTEMQQWADEICGSGNCADPVRMLHAEALLFRRDADGFAKVLAAIVNTRARRIVNADLDPDHVDDPATFTGAEMLALTGRETEYAAHRAALFGGIDPHALHPLVALRLARGALLFPGPPSEFTPALRTVQSALPRVDGPDRTRAQAVLAWACLRTDQPNRATELARAVVARSNDPIALAVLALSAHRSGNGAQFQALATRLVLLVQGSAGDNDPERWVLLMLADEVMRAKERSPGARDP
ncbi:MAG: hypothetical protein ACOVT5_03540, partial [Armatimonadaceae bacterium]